MWRGGLTSYIREETRKLRPFYRGNEANAYTPNYNPLNSLTSVLLASHTSPSLWGEGGVGNSLVEARAHGMFIRTRIPHGTVSLDKQRTCPPVRIEAKPVLLPQEVVEREPTRELLLLRVRVENLIGDTGGSCSRHRRGGVRTGWQCARRVLNHGLCGALRQRQGNQD